MDSPQLIESTCAKKKAHAASQEEKTSKKLERAQWLRAAILGANDGLLSTTSLMLGVGAAKDQDQLSMVLSGVAGAFAGACSMAVGEFVSVSTQRDIAKSIADNCRSENELKGEDGGYKTKIQIACSSPTIAETKQGDATNMSFRNILATSTQGGKLLYESPVQIQHHIALTPARSPMIKVMENDAKRTIMQESKQLENDRKLEPLPNPLKAAASSSLAFLFGAFVPMVPALVVSENRIRIGVIVIVASLALYLFGGIGAYLGGSSVKISAVRALFGGWISMAITYALLMPFDKDTKNDNDD
ncbi:vacuolar iron transporter homolog 4-like [Nicotiana tabacum]|uniref:Vacuolar iron transporter homolog 1-like n=2 Tax=Nicotiana TaxID=4085 RepID=A0A1S4CUH0_TOBAC|nr:PREDICTED: vacuolar iron transporter homolog 1-like [Nicotiana sylvestris]XP_016504770.1 PREDICTED: vacuolar iron transporter homolog 1-like [Nicotiana tabacum]